MTGGQHLILLLATSVSVTAGLRCYVCSHTEVETSNMDVKRAVDAVVPQDEACLRDDVANMTQVVCPKYQNQNGTCVKSTAAVSFESFGTEVTVIAKTRACAPVGTQGCETSRNISQFGTAFAPLSVEPKSFKVTTCTCSVDWCNKQTRHVPALTTCLTSLVLAILVYI